MLDIYRRLMVDQERFNKLTNPLGDLDKIINPAGSAITQLSAAVTATDVFAKTSFLTECLPTFTERERFQNWETR